MCTNRWHVASCPCACWVGSSATIHGRAGTAAAAVPGWSAASRWHWTMETRPGGLLFLCANWFLACTNTKKEERRKVFFFFFNLFLFCLVSIGQADQSSIHCKKLTNGVYFLAVTVKSFKLSMMVTPRAFLCIAASYGLSFAWVQCWVPASHFVTYSVTRSCA